MFLPLDRTRARAKKLEAKFLGGVYLGVGLGTNEMDIGTKTGVVRDAAIERKTEQVRVV